MRAGAILRRFRELLASSRIAAERDEEFAFHLEMEIEHNLRRGMSPDEARRAATLRFGGRERFRDEVRDRRGFVLLDDLRRDVRLAWRRTRRAPAFAAGVIATLGIGIGAAVGIGGIVQRVLISELPYPGATSLVRVSFLTPGNTVSGDLHSNATYVHLARAQSFDAFAAYYTNEGITLTDGDNPERAVAAMVTPGLFHMLGVTPVLGSLFAPQDTAWGKSIPVLISQELWERRYGGDPDIIGRKIAINRGERRVIGVVPASFDFPDPAVGLYYPLSLDLASASLEQRYYEVIARLKPGVEPRAGETELNALLQTLPARFPQITAEAVASSGARVTVRHFKEWMLRGVRGQLVLLGIMVAVVLVIATANVITLLLLRTERSAHETAVALSLGATRAGIGRRFVVEGMLLGLVSVVVALPIAGVILGTRLGVTTNEIPRLHEVTFGLPAIAIVVATALLLGAALGLAAFTRAVSDHVSIADRLRGGARATASRAWQHAQRFLVTTQIAFALALIVCAALLARSFQNLRTVDLGFEPANAMAFEVTLPWNGYASVEASSAFHARVLDELRAIPGVTGAVAASKLPLTPHGLPPLPLQLEGVDGGRPIGLPVGSGVASGEYFRVMGIPLVRGRSFAPGDLRGDAPAIVLSENVARALFGSGDPIGRRVRRSPAVGVRPTTFRVIGVAGDVPGERIEDGPAPMVYLPLLRDGDGLPGDSSALPIVPRGVQYVVSGSVLPTAQQIRQVVHGIDRRVPAMAIQPLTALVDGATARVRLTLLLLSVASAGALLLGIVGVYSVVAYAASGRMREFGVRIALGAAPRRVGSMVLRDGVMMAATGVAAGLVVAVNGTRFLRSLLFDVSATSVVEFGVAVVLVAAVTVLATMIPARRAARTDPAIVLRGE